MFLLKWSNVKRHFTDFNLVPVQNQEHKTWESILNTPLSNKYDHVHYQINTSSSANFSDKLRQNAVYPDCPLKTSRKFYATGFMREN